MLLLLTHVCLHSPVGCYCGYNMHVWRHMFHVCLQAPGNEPVWRQVLQLLAEPTDPFVAMVSRLASAQIHASFAFEVE